MKFSLGCCLIASCLAGVQPALARAQERDAGVTREDTRAPDASSTFGPWTRDGVPPVPPRESFDMPDDESLQFIIRDGSGGWSFFDCVSEAPDASTIDDPEALPVGEGRTLSCSTEASPAVMEQMLMGEDGRLYCWKGALTQYRTVGDARLSVRVEQTPAAGPWRVRATSETSWVMRRSAFAVGMIWPLWLELSYQTTDFAPAVDFRCDGVF